MSYVHAVLNLLSKEGGGRVPYRQPKSSKGEKHMLVVKRISPLLARASQVVITSNVLSLVPPDVHAGLC